MNVRVARIFNTYGPRMHMNDGRVVSNFILQALQEDIITVSLNVDRATILLKKTEMHRGCFIHFSIK